MFFFGGFGMIGNALSIFVLLKKEKICFNYLLVALNVFDTFHIVFAFLDVIRNNHEDYYPEALLAVFPYFHYPLYRLSLCCSIFIVVSITIERFLAVTKPHYRLVSNVKRAVCYIVPCVLLAVLLNLSKFFETETVRFCLDFTACGCGYHYKLYVRPTRLRLSQNYIMWYTTWTWVSTTSIIPFLTLLVLNIIIYRKLKEAKAVSARLNASQQNQKSRDACAEKTNLSSSTILLCTVATFLVCHSPRLMLSVYEAVMITSILHCQSKLKGITPIWYLYAMASVQLLQVINTSFNFPIYWFVGNFRETFLAIFCGWRKKVEPTPNLGVSTWDTSTSILSIALEERRRKKSFDNNQSR